MKEDAGKLGYAYACGLLYAMKGDSIGEDGGEGSGNFHHLGRKGLVGGSISRKPKELAKKDKNTERDFESPKGRSGRKDEEDDSDKASSIYSRRITQEIVDKACDKAERRMDEGDEPKTIESGLVRDVQGYAEKNGERIQITTQLVHRGAPEVKDEGSLKDFIGSVRGLLRRI